MTVGAPADSPSLTMTLTTATPAVPSGKSISQVYFLASGMRAESAPATPARTSVAANSGAAIRFMARLLRFGKGDVGGIPRTCRAACEERSASCSLRHPDRLGLDDLAEAGQREYLRGPGDEGQAL